jgi:hypothetical protein
MGAFIDDHSDKLGVEPNFEVLLITPSSHYDHLTKLADPARQTDRSR